MNFYSQQSEDVILWKKYLNYKNGFFIELGAMDGIKYSNTKFFEDSLGWKGILIEPEKNQFQRLKRNRPNCILSDYAISETDGEVVFNTRNGGDSGGGIVDTHIDETIREEDNVKLISKPFTTLLKEVGKPERVDLFVIDVEGGELGILKTFDWSIPVYIICIETHPSNKHYEECKQILVENGFEFDMTVGINEVWINKNNKRAEA
jgi:FkbM family methyltransferase